MFKALAVQNRSKAFDSKCDVRPCTNSKIVKHFDKRVVGSSLDPRFFMGGNWQFFVRAYNLEASNHWSINWVCISLAKLMDNMINESGLGEGNSMLELVVRNGNA